MVSSTTGPGNVWRRRLPLLIVGIIAIALVLPAAVYGGFMVNVATVTFTETTGSLTASTPQASVSPSNQRSVDSETVVLAAMPCPYKAIYVTDNENGESLAGEPS